MGEQDHSAIFLYLHENLNHFQRSVLGYGELVGLGWDQRPSDPGDQEVLEALLWELLAPQALHFAISAGLSNLSRKLHPGAVVQECFTGSFLPQ